MTGQSELRQAHADLLACYKDIRQEFADLDDQTLARFLGKYNSAHFRQQVREHGDGYTMRSVPSSAQEILLADVVVMIVMNSPLLNHDSVFRLHASLPEIRYWRRDKRGLRSKARLQNGDLARFQFLVWEQDRGVHGENISGKSARQALANEQLLIEQRPCLRQLLQEQAQKSEELLRSCMNWLESIDRKLIVLTSKKKKEFNPPIAQLLSDDRVLHIPTELFGRRECTIMDELIWKLSEES